MKKGKKKIPREANPNGIPMSQSEIAKVRSLHKMGLGQRTIAKLIGRSRRTIRRWVDEKDRQRNIKLSIHYAREARQFYWWAKKNHPKWIKEFLSSPPHPKRV